MGHGYINISISVNVTFIHISLHIVFRILGLLAIAKYVDNQYYDASPNGNSFTSWQNVLYIISKCIFSFLDE